MYTSKDIDLSFFSKYFTQLTYNFNLILMTLMERPGTPLKCVVTTLS